MSQDSAYRRMQSEREKWIGTIRKYEEMARRSPAKYKAKIRRFAAFGYLFIFSLLFIILLLIAMSLYAAFVGVINALTIKLAIGFVAVGAIIVRSLFVTIGRPEGVEVTRADAPRLFEMVDELRSRLKTPPIHIVILTGDYNAFAAQRPMWGLFGPSENTLAIGLPYMSAASPDELKATIAHEFGHFAGDHSAFGGKIYRLNMTWARLSGELQGRSAGSILAPFLKWYMPRFDALTFALRRANEYEADEAAVRIGGAEPNSTDLMKFAVQGRGFHQEFWNSIGRRVPEIPNPPQGIIQESMEYVRRPVDLETAKQWLRDAFEAETSYADTHPSLTDRLRAMNSLPDLQEDAAWDELVCRIANPPEVSAAEELLGEALPLLAAKVDALWRKEAMEGWLEDHVLRKPLLEELRSVEETEAMEGESIALLSRKAELTSRLYGKEAEPICRRIVELDENHPQANFCIGVWMAETGDLEAEEYLNRAMQADPNLKRPVSEILFHLHELKGRHDEAERAFETIGEQIEFSNNTLEEVQKMKAKDQLIPLHLTEDQLRDLRNGIPTVHGVTEAYAVRQPSKYQPSGYNDVLVIAVELKWSQKHSSVAYEIMDRAVGEVVQFSPVSVRAIGPSEGSLAKRVRSIGFKVWPV